MVSKHRLNSLTTLLVAGFAAACALPAAAVATYPGVAGELVHEDAYSYEDVLNNGAISYEFHLGATRPGGGGAHDLVACQGSDVGFFNGTQFCPMSGDGFAPNGRTVVFSGVSFNSLGAETPVQRDCVATCESLVLTAADGSDLRLVSSGLPDAEGPAFMPDGRTIVFAGRTGRRGVGATPQLYTVGEDGSGLRQLTRTGGDDPAPCPNGTIAYVHAGDLYLMSAGGRSRRRLTRRGGALPDCSADSRTIAFLRGRHPYALSSTGTRLRQLSHLTALSARPTLSPAGGELAFVTAHACTTRSCRAMLKAARCTDVSYRLEQIRLSGRLLHQTVIGSNACTSDGNLGGDNPGALAWQPLAVSAAPTLSTALR